MDVGQWQHVAAVFQPGGGITFYKSGETTPFTSSQIDYPVTDMAVTIGNNPNYIYEYFAGAIDEVRVWNISGAANMRTQTLIRDTMCQKLAGNEADLGGYWRFDEETASNTCPDYSGNANNGTMVGFADIRASRICSSAPIGDDSDWVYYSDVGAGNVNVTLSHPDGDYLYVEYHFL